MKIKIFVKIFAAITFSSMVTSCFSMSLKHPEAPLSFDPVGTYHLVPIEHWEPAKKYGFDFSMTGVLELRKDENDKLDFHSVLFKVVNGTAIETYYSSTSDSEVKTSADEINISDVGLTGIRPDGSKVKYWPSRIGVLLTKQDDGFLFDFGGNLAGPEYYFKKIDTAPVAKQGPPPTFKGSVFLVDAANKRISVVGDQVPDKLRKGSAITFVRNSQIIGRGTVAEVFANRAIVSSPNIATIHPRDEVFGWK